MRICPRTCDRDPDKSATYCQRSRNCRGFNQGRVCRRDSQTTVQRAQIVVNVADLRDDVAFDLIAHQRHANGNGHTRDTADRQRDRCSSGKAANLRFVQRRDGDGVTEYRITRRGVAIAVDIGLGSHIDAVFNIDTRARHTHRSHTAAGNGGRACNGR